MKSQSNDGSTAGLVVRVHREELAKIANTKLPALFRPRRVSPPSVCSQYGEERDRHLATSPPCVKARGTEGTQGRRKKSLGIQLLGGGGGEEQRP